MKYYISSIATSQGPQKSGAWRPARLLREAAVDVVAQAQNADELLRHVPVVDPTIVVGRRRREDPLPALTDREREVLGLLAEGLSNKAIAGR